MKAGYYPGCSLHSSAKEYNLSARLVLGKLGIELEEIPDWNCCGAVEASSLNHLLALSLPARNLALAAKVNKKTLVMSCTACLLNSLKAQEEMKKNADLKKTITEIIGSEIREDLQIKHFLQIIIEQSSLEEIAKLTQIPLQNIKIAPYYGCVIVRPSELMKFDHPESPTSLDRIITALGGICLPYQHKTKCCGGALLLTNEEICLEMVKGILEEAKQLTAHCVIVLCPMCHMALENLYPKVEKKYNLNLDFPILHFTQLIGLAFGFKPKELGLDRNLISPQKLVEEVGIKWE
jgi:heterodisulfide reductase subunit B